eukprot:2347407-Pleurochrysis_carterae.AAC.1
MHTRYRGRVRCYGRQRMAILAAYELALSLVVGDSPSESEAHLSRDAQTPLPSHEHNTPLQKVVAITSNWHR